MTLIDRPERMVGNPEVAGAAIKTAGTSCSPLRQRLLTRPGFILPQGHRPAAGAPQTGTTCWPADYIRIRMANGSRFAAAGFSSSTMTVAAISAPAGAVDSGSIAV